jgi:enamine deaminase RidA (YjgF/YER057c/UK114 family)
MPPKLVTYTFEAPQATECFITAAPGAAASADEQLRATLSEVAGELRSRGAAILQERLFGTQAAMDAALDIRSQLYGDLDDGVPPSLLVVEEGAGGPFAGAQIHAVVTDAPTKPVEHGGRALGRLLDLPERSCLALLGVSAPGEPDNAAQARGMFEIAEAALSAHEIDFFSVPRTWMWLGDILSWYDDFNAVRNDYFKTRGILSAGGPHQMPASTGIGIGPSNGGACSMDLVAVFGRERQIEYLTSTGKQESAFDYGSAFSRAARATAVAGETVYISGTASIDAAGRTTHLDDAEAQIAATVENVRAVLRQMQCSDTDIVQAMAYCKTREVEAAFADVAPTLPWPALPMIADVCRGDLLFEIEATALPGASRKS